MCSRQVTRLLLRSASVTKDSAIAASCDEPLAAGRVGHTPRGGSTQSATPKSIVKKSTTGSLPPAVPLATTPTFSPWTHTSDDSYIYQLSLVLATATVSFRNSLISIDRHLPVYCRRHYLSIDASHSLRSYCHRQYISRDFSLAYRR